LEIFESRAISRYLAVKNESPLIPHYGDAKAVAAFEQLASVEYAYFEPAVSTLAFELIFKRLDSAVIPRADSWTNNRCEIGFSISERLARPLLISRRPCSIQLWTITTEF
jgi:glutathione S-transferase